MPAAAPAAQDGNEETAQNEAELAQQPAEALGVGRKGKSQAGF